MLRNIAIIVIGVAAGAIGLSLAFPPQGENGVKDNLDTPFALLEIIRGLGRHDPAQAPAVLSIGERLQVYEAVATRDFAALESRLAVLAGEPSSPAIDVEIDAALARLADIDSLRAAQIAVSMNLDARFLARAFGYLAETDASAAIAGLGMIRDPGSRRMVALSLLEIIGESQANVDRISAALPETDQVAFRTDWLERRAAEDPYGAFRDALAIGDRAQRAQSLQRVAEVWAEQDPIGALAQAEQAGDRLTRTMFRSAVSSRWARLDPLGFLGYLQSGAVEPEDLQGGFQWLAATDPNALLDIADGLTGGAGRNLRLIALYEMAAFDPEAALASVEGLPLGTDRQLMLSQVASRYAETDPAGALAWARSLDPPSPDVVDNVVQNIVRSNAELAIEVIVDPPPGVNVQLITAMIGALGMQDPDQAMRMADLLLVQDNPLARNALTDVVGNWMRRDEGAALDWMTRNLARLDDGTIGQAAQAMARRDPAGAAAYLSRIPPEHRDVWIAQIAAPYAAYDPAGATNWISQYQGSPVYGTAYRQMVMQIAQTDPDAAGNLLLQAGPDVQFGAAAEVARAMAQRDPRGAATWAGRLADPRARATAIGAAVDRWARNDISAARNWSLGQPEGEPRDRALVQLLPYIASSGDFDRRVLEAISSASARTEALTQAVPMLARSDPERAREIFDSLDGAQRVLIEQRMRAQGISF